MAVWPVNLRTPDEGYSTSIEQVTVLSTSDTGLRLSRKARKYPLFSCRVRYNGSNMEELSKLYFFFRQMDGRFREFTFTDFMGVGYSPNLTLLPVPLLIGYGDGATTDYDLPVRFGSDLEISVNFADPFTEGAGFTLHSAAGRDLRDSVTFDTAPIDTAEIRVVGGAGRLCIDAAFAADSMPFEQFSAAFSSMTGIEIRERRGGCHIRVSPGSGSFPGGELALAYSEFISGFGGSAPYSFTVVSGALPDGLTLDPATGEIAGTPTAIGTFSFAVRVASATGGCFDDENYMIAIGCPTITLTPASLDPADTGVGYFVTVTASGGTAPYTYAITSGTLPDGLALTAGTGDISGTPTTPGLHTFTVTATDANGCTGSHEYSLNPGCPAITVTGSTVAATVGTAYSRTFGGSGGTSPYTFSTTGSVPPGLSIGSSSGILSGTPTAAGTYSFSIDVLDANDCPGSADFSITVSCPSITLDPTSITGVVVGSALSVSIIASGGTESYTYAVTSGSLPPGTALDPGGDINGTTTTAGSFSFTITATDANGCTGSRAYTVRICQVITLLMKKNSDGSTQTSPYSFTNHSIDCLAALHHLLATGGTAPYVYTKTGTMPTGWTLNSDGTITGNFCDNSESRTLTFTATDANGCVGNLTFQFILDTTLV